MDFRLNSNKISLHAPRNTQRVQSVHFSNFAQNVTIRKKYHFYYNQRGVPWREALVQTQRKTALFPGAYCRHLQKTQSSQSRAMGINIPDRAVLSATTVSPFAVKGHVFLAAEVPQLQTVQFPTRSFAS